MNDQIHSQAPTPEEFLDPHRWPPETDEGSESSLSMSFNGQPLGGPHFYVDPGQLHVLPPDPMERVASALETLVELYANPLQEIKSAEFVTDEAPATWARKAAEAAEEVRTLSEVADDWRDKYGAAVDVIDQVEAALGKSTAKPALAAKAVIEAYKNPAVSEPEGSQDDVQTCPSCEGVGCEACSGVGQWVGEPLLVVDADKALGTQPADSEPVPMNGSHTRTPHESGPDFCRECSSAASDWVQWPCPAAAVADAVSGGAAVQVVDQPQQPAHDAPVEDWRAYARQVQGVGEGTVIDKMNRSQIRTQLGIAQPVKTEAELSAGA